MTTDIDSNRAENNIALASGDGPKPRRGRRIAIEDGRLWNNRDSLVFLLENTWADVGDKLPKIKKLDHAYEVLRVWEQANRYNHLYVTQILLRPSSTPATAKSLNEKRRRMRDLNVAARCAYESLEKCCKSFEIAMRAATGEYSESEQATIHDKIKERAEILAHAGAEYLALTDEQKNTEEHIKDCEAHFARTEFVRFCKSRRYRLTPLNTANALAGLPDIGWRQSAKRCTMRVCPGLNGGSMQVFEAIRRIVQSCTRKSELVKHAERWLSAQRNTKSFGVADLQTNWYYLRASIKTALEAGIRSRDLPFAIAREYWKRKYHPSNADVLFADDERIGV
jgi:hypothetical protein